ncbi:DedA family protein [Demetria terragena]|uniref:DedA family protein n=1 Tax=Demetria terragena TaxID=63959 RepID=UPI0003801CD8|nr:VTT domain-containing protein [Demetria terragena]
MTPRDDPTQPDPPEDSPGDPDPEQPMADAAPEDLKDDSPPEWWEDPRMPWQGKPTTADKRCWAAFMLLGVYGLVMVPLRPLILGMSTYALAAISGSTVAMVDIGAGLKLGGEPHWWFWLVVASLSVMKFDWIFWWAGRLWGHGMIEVIGGRSRWAAKMGRHAERLAERFGGLATFLVWVVPLLPSAVVFVFVGMSKMKLRTFLIINFIGAFTNRAIYMYLGYRIGEPAKDVVDVIQKYSLYISIVLIVVIVFKSVRSSRRPQTTETAPPETS